MSYDPTHTIDIAELELTFANNNEHLLFVKCSLDETVTTSEIIISESHIDPMRDDGFVIYKLGNIGAVIDGKREAHMLWGNIRGGAGASAYVYKAYATAIDGTGFTLISNPALRFVALLKSTVEIPVPVVTDFAGLWYNIDGKHNDNTEKQGGSVELDEFFHLTQAQLNDLITPETPIVKIDTGATEIQSTIGYGYNFAAATDSRHIAASNAHVPSIIEFQELADSIGANGAYFENTVGGKLKKTTGWDEPNVGATNNFGFDAIGSGVRLGLSFNFAGIGQSLIMWSATEWNGSANVAVLRCDTDEFRCYEFSGYSINDGLSIRLVVDAPVEINGNDAIYVGNNGLRYNCRMMPDGKWWLVQNLMESQFRNGDIIPKSGENEINYTGSEWGALTEPGRYAYNDDESIVSVLGTSLTSINIGDTIVIPSKTSELVNDAGFITVDDIPAPPTVPTLTSELTNDAGFITEADLPSPQDISGKLNTTFDNIDDDAAARTALGLGAVALMNIIEVWDVAELQTFIDSTEYQFGVMYQVFDALDSTYAPISVLTDIATILAEFQTKQQIRIRSMRQSWINL